MSSTTLRVGPLTPDETGWSAPPLPWLQTRKPCRARSGRGLVAGPWRRDDLVDRGGRALVRRGRWLRPLVGRLLAAFPGAGRRPPGSRRSCATTPGSERVPRNDGRGRHRPAPAAAGDGPGARGRRRRGRSRRSRRRSGWPSGSGSNRGELDWFADRQGRERTAADGPLRHYHYRWQAEADRLGPADRGAPAPAQGDPAAAARRDPRRRSRRTTPRTGSGPAGRSGRSSSPTSGGRSSSRWTSATSSRRSSRPGSSPCSGRRATPRPWPGCWPGSAPTAVPADVWPSPTLPGPGPDAWRARRLYRRPHLPQGAPTSPALANLARLPARLPARRPGRLGRGAATPDTPTTWPSPAAPTFARSVDRFHRPRRRDRARGGVRRPAPQDPGDASGRPPAGRRGRRSTTGRTSPGTTSTPSRPPSTTASRHGPPGQNRAGHADFRAHLAGRIAHVATLNPTRGRAAAVALRSDRLVRPLPPSARSFFKGSDTRLAMGGPHP